MPDYATGRVTRQDIADVLLCADTKDKGERERAVTFHLGKYLKGEKRGKKALQAVLDDLDSYSRS